MYAFSTKLAALLTLAATSTLAQGRAEEVGGSWTFSNDGQARAGIVSNPGDGEWSFLWLRCGEFGGRPTPILSLEVDPKHFGEAVLRQRFIIVRSRLGVASVEVIAARIVLNEAGAHLWSLEFDLGDRSVLQSWRQAGNLSLEIGEKEHEPATVRRTYRVRAQGRERAITSFLDACP